LFFLRRGNQVLSFVYDGSDWISESFFVPLVTAGTTGVSTTATSITEVTDCIRPIVSQEGIEDLGGRLWARLHAELTTDSDDQTAYLQLGSAVANAGSAFSNSFHAGSEVSMGESTSVYLVGAWTNVGGSGGDGVRLTAGMRSSDGGNTVRCHAASAECRFVM
jgi:hypothetical protein